MLFLLLPLMFFADHWALNNKQTFLNKLSKQYKKKKKLVRSQFKKNPSNPIYKSMENKCTLPPFFTNSVKTEK